MNNNANFFYKSIFNSLRVSYARVGVIVVSLFIGACVSSAFLNMSLDIESKLSNELKVYGANFIISPAHGQNHIDSQVYERKIAMIPKDKLKAAAPFVYGFFSLGNNSAIVAGVDFGALKSVFPFIEVREGHFGNSVFDENSVFVGVSLAKAFEIKAGSQITLTNPKSLDSVDLEVKGIISSGDEFDGIVFAPIKVVQNLVADSSGNSSLTQSSRELEKSSIDRQQALSHSDFSAQPTNLVQDTRIAESKKATESSLRGVANAEAIQKNNNVDCHDLTKSSLAMTENSVNCVESSNDSTKSQKDNRATSFIHYAKLILYGNFSEVAQIGANLSDDLVSAKPIAQVSISEGIVLGKIKALMLLICLIILLIASLSVNTSLSSIIFARKKEVALHLSLGAKKAQIAKLFGAEVLILALVSSVVGALCGYLLANLLGFIIFNSSVSFRILSVVGAVAITLISAFLASFYPIKKALNINIIKNLKGE